MLCPDRENRVGYFAVAAPFDTAAAQPTQGERVFGIWREKANELREFGGTNNKNPLDLAGQTTRIRSS
jgi:hypothetical protein